MLEMIQEIFELPGFWILLGLSVGAEVIGFMLSKNMEGMMAFPVWQFIILVVGTIIGCGVIAYKMS